MLLDKFKKLFKDNTVNEELARKYKQTFSTPTDLEVLEDLLKFCKVHQPTFVPGQPDVSQHNEGMRRVGLRLLSLTQAEPKAVKTTTINQTRG